MNETVNTIVKRHLETLKTSQQRTLAAVSAHQKVAESLEKQIQDCVDFIEAAKTGPLT